MGEQFLQHGESSETRDAGEKIDLPALLARMRRDNYKTPLTREEEDALFTHYRSMVKDSEEKLGLEDVLVRQYTPLVVRIARRAGIDEKQVGLSGLRYAIEHFEPKGIRFVSYTYRSLRNAIFSELGKESGSLYIPPHAYQELADLSKKELRGDPLTQEEELRIEELRQSIARKANYRDIDELDANGMDDEEESIREGPTSPTYSQFLDQQRASLQRQFEDPFEEIAEKERRDLLEIWIQELTGSEKRILRARLDGKTRPEIADDMKMSEEHIKRIENIALRKLTARANALR